MADSTQSQNPSSRNKIEDPRRSKNAESQARYRARNLEKCREREQNWRVKNTEYRRHKRLQVRYGVTAEQYDAALEKQGGVCAICNEKSRDGRRLAVDHCHYTGKLRGLLCFHCNTAIGKLGDTADKVVRAVKYLKDGGH